MLEIKEEELKKILPSDGPSINEVKKYLEKYNDEYIVIKCGGSVLINRYLFDIFIRDIATLNKLGFIPIIVHGGGKRINNKLNQLGIESNFVKGLRVTGEETIQIVEEVLIEFNKEIVESLEQQNCKSQSINTKENNIISVIQENEKLGFVGFPTNINKSVIDKIIDEKKVPVIAPLGLSKESKTYNINADTAAGSIAKKIKARRLIIISDVEGVLDSNNKLIPEINSDSIRNLIDNETISGGMIPKVETCVEAVKNGVKAAVILDGRLEHSILLEIFTEHGVGTLITN